MKSKNNDRGIEYVCEKYNVKRDVARKVCYFPFKVLKDIIKNMRKDTLYLRKFGRFVVPHYSRNFIDNLNNYISIQENAKKNINNQIHDYE